MHAARSVTALRMQILNALAPPLQVQDAVGGAEGAAGGGHARQGAFRMLIDGAVHAAGLYMTPMP